MSHPIEPGALARTIRRTSPAYSFDELGEGLEFEVETYVPAEEAEDGIDFYWGNADGGMMSVCVRAEDVEQVKTKAEMEARALPSVGDIAEHLVSEALGGFGAKFDIHEADYGAGDGFINLYGKTREGLPFAVAVKVLDVERTDW